jgi:hypothetical protein
VRHVDDHVRDEPVERIALFEELVELYQHVAVAKERAARVVLQAVNQRLGRKAKIDHSGSLVQYLAITFAQDRTPAGRDHRFGFASETSDDLFLDLTESLFAITLEHRRNSAPCFALDLPIRIKTSPRERLRQMPCDRGLAASRQAHEGDQGQSVWPLADAKTGMPMLVARPLGDVNVSVTVPLVMPVVKL